MASFYGELIIRISADDSGLQKTLARDAALVKASAAETAAASNKWAKSAERAGLAMQNIGRTMTQFVTIPVAAGFAVAAYSAIKYENSLLKVKNLTGMTAAETDKYRQSLLEMAGDVGVTAQSLSESLYFIASSGFEGKEALDMLTVSAKASASGMGDQVVVADALTSAVNAYGHGNLSAARATDILMKTIQVGKAEPEQLAASLGRIMPVAAQLGVSFGQVGGAIAGLTLTGLSSAEAVTALRGTMIALVAPAKMSIDEMKRVGTSYQEVTEIIRDRGLLPALEFLREKTDGNMLSMRKIIPNVRALNGVLALLGENYQKNVEVTKKVIDSNGKLDTAFAFTQKTTIFKLKQAWAQMYSAFIRIGEDILPTLAKVVDGIARMADAFSRLPEGTRGAILWGLAVSAALGPVLMMLGSIVRTAALAKIAISGIKAASAGAAGVDLMAGIGGGAAGAGGAKVMAGLVRLIPVAALAAAVATAIVQGINEGIKKAKELNAEGRGGWATFWQDLWEVSEAIRLKVGGKGEFDANVAAWAKSQQSIITIVADANVKIANLMNSRNEFLAAKGRYLQRAFEGAMKMPEIKAALELDTEIPKKKLMELRQLLITSLHIPGKEASAIMRMIFPADWGRAAPKSVKDIGVAMDALKKKAAEFRNRLDEAVHFKDDKSIDKWKAKIAKVMHEVELLAQKRAIAIAESLGEDIPTKAGLGLNKHAPKLSKGMTAMLKSGVFVPLQLIETDIKTQSEKNGNAVGDGMTKAQKKAARIAQQLVTAILNPLQKGTGAASGAGAALGGAYVSSIAMFEQAAYDAGYRVGQAGARGINEGQDSASPSKKAIQSGIWLVEGYAIGIKKGTDKAIAAAAELAGNIVSVLDAALQISADVSTLQEQGLPTTALAKKWAKRVSVMLRAIYKAMAKELKSLDLLDKEKGDKTIPGAGTRFSAVATMAGDIGSILSAFTEMTAESLDKSFVAMALVKKNAKLIGANIVGMAKAVIGAMKGLLVSEFTGTNVSRAVQIASDLATAITTFSEITGKAVDGALGGLSVTARSALYLGWLVRLIAERVKLAFANATVDEKIAAAVSEAVQLASDIAGVIDTFAEMTQKKLDAALSGLAMLFGDAPGTGATYIQVIAHHLGVIAYNIKQAFADASADLVVAGAESEAVQFANDIADIILKFAEMTEKTVTAAMGGITRVVAAAPELGSKLNEMVGKLAGAFKQIADNPLFAPASAIASGVASFVSDVASIVGDLAGMMDTGGGMTEPDAEGKSEAIPLVQIVKNALEGAANVSLYASELGKALLKMVSDLSDALGVPFDTTKLTDLKDVLGLLGEISGSIKSIVDELADMTAEKISAANSAGASLGNGFLAGLKSTHDAIVAEARRIVSDATAELLKTVPVPAGASVVASSGSGGTSSTVGAARFGGAPTVVNQYNTTNVYALEPDEALAAKLVRKQQVVQRRSALEMARKMPR